MIIIFMEAYHHGEGLNLTPGKCLETNSRANVWSSKFSSSFSSNESLKPAVMSNWGYSILLLEDDMLEVVQKISEDDCSPVGVIGLCRIGRCGRVERRAWTYANSACKLTTCVCVRNQTMRVLNIGWKIKEKKI